MSDGFRIASQLFYPIHPGYYGVCVCILQYIEHFLAHLYCLANSLPGGIHY